MSDPAELADRLEEVASDLDEYMFDRLREAAADGASGRRPEDDKRLLAARRAIDKAVNLLRGR